ncbi:MAG: SpoIIE family protein phosphatase [Clostridia bacterium]|nr:SpoIIE family protein phosphatase [Clostridia bacterium]
MKNVRKLLDKLFAPISIGAKKVWKRLSPLLRPVAAFAKKRWKPLIALLSALIVTALAYSNVLLRVDRWTQDRMFQRPRALNTDIVVIGIDSETQEKLGNYSIAYRSYIADALTRMYADGDPSKQPAAVALDFLYIGESEDTYADLDLFMAAYSLKNVITATEATFQKVPRFENRRAVSYEYEVTKYEEPYERLKSVTAQGVINIMPDMDSVMRHAILYVDIDENTRVYSMDYIAASKYAEAHGMTLKEPSVIGKNNFFYIAYSAEPSAFKPAGYFDFNLADVIEGKVPADYWAGKLVLIGMHADNQDAFETPISAENMYGVEIHANVIQAILEGNYKTDAPEWAQLIVLFALSFAAMLLFLNMRLPWGAALCLGLVLLSVGGTMLMYKYGVVAHPLWLAVAAVLMYIAALALKYFLTARERRALALEKERIATELALAARIQANYLPKQYPERRELELAASMTPAKEVGGDLYDFFLIDEDHLCLVIGDVSGKGVPASLFMMLSSSLIHHVAMRDTSPANILHEVNAEICSRNPEEMFVTVWLGILEISTGKLTAANAGHEYPALKRSGASFDILKDKHGFVVGGMNGVRYRNYEMQLLPGEKLFVYTDGVPEANDAAGEMFGEGRMVAALRECEDGTPSQILSEVQRAVNAFAGDAPQFDDLTMLCLQYNGADAAD